MSGNLKVYQQNFDKQYDWSIHTRIDARKSVPYMYQQNSLLSDYLMPEHNNHRAGPVIMTVNLPVNDIQVHVVPLLPVPSTACPTHILLA